MNAKADVEKKIAARGLRIGDWGSWIVDH